MTQTVHLTGTEMVVAGNTRLPRVLRFERLTHWWTWTYVGYRSPMPGEWCVRDALAVASYVTERELLPQHIVKPATAYAPAMTYRLMPSQPSRIP